MTKGADDLIAAIVIAGQADLVNINEKKARIGFAPLLKPLSNYVRQVRFLKIIG